jgi:multiple sugar transport system permease protein/sn-glycerol 3-phosphate transport system permease protein
MSATLIRHSHEAAVDSPARMRRFRRGDVLRLIAVLALAALMGFPVYITFATALFPDGELVRYGLFPPLGDLTTANFGTALQSIPLAQQYLVSLAVVVLQTAAEVATASLAAYSLVFPSWRGRGVAFSLVVATLAVPGESLIIPNYELVTGMGLRDTLIGIVVPFLSVGYPIFLLRQAFGSLPRELWEAARLDGCGDLRTLVLVVMPAARSHVTTAVMWSALAAWNGFFWPLLVTNSAANRTVQVGLSQLVTAETTSPAVIFAGSALVLIPTIVLVIASQRLLVSGMSRGALK